MEEFEGFAQQRAGRRWRGQFGLAWLVRLGGHVAEGCGDGLMGAALVGLEREHIVRSP